MKPFHGSHRRPTHSAQGAALLLVLCFVVLTAGLMVAFFSRSTTERQVSNFSAGSTKVELLADTALDLVVDGLKQEIVNHSNTSGSGTNTLYVPTLATYAVPQRQTALPSTLANLLRISSRSDNTTRAVSASTSGTSLNGRSVSFPRWNLHYLLPLKNPGTVGDTTPDPSFPSPDWVIVTRSGTATGSGWNHSLADAAPSNTNYAIGRYAYAIYDEGGLLDANVAGYPSSATADQSGPKGGIAYADLTQLSLTISQINQLVGWRNYATAQPSGTFPNFGFDTAAASRFQSWATSSSTQFLSLTGTATYNGNTDHAILNRQQLIKLLLSTGTTTADQVQLQGALQYLGTFTREVNGPTVSGTGANLTDFNPAAIFGVKVSGTFTRADGSLAVVGEPLVKNRFPLEKLALLEKMQGVSSLSAQDKNDIARYFGLDPVSDSNGNFRHWSYPTASPVYRHGQGASGAGGIMSLADVATQNREPDFFELLQAGIYQGSLGKGNVRSDLLQGGMGYTLPSFSDPDTKTTLQLLRIGANIIDQWDSDNYPTTITYTPSGDSVYGIEDLPYIDKFLTQVTGTNINYTLPYTFSCGFVLWNPHQLLASNTGAYPTYFRILPLSDSGSVQNSDWYSISVVGNDANGTRGYWCYDVANGKWTAGSPTQRFSDIPSNGGTVGPFPVLKSSFREPGMTDTLTIFKINSFPDDTVTSGTLKWSKVMSDQPQVVGSKNWNVALRFPFSIVYCLQYQDPSGAYRTYGTFVGQDRTGVATGFRQAVWTYFHDTTTSGWCSFPKPDPRTYRFASGFAALNANPSQSLTPYYNTTVAPIFQNDPFVANNSTTPNQSFSNNTYRADLWTVNDPTDQVFNGATADPATFNGNKPYYFDPDGKARPGDSVYSWSASPSQSPLYISGTAARPVILNHPFRSVGELGYAFRDIPWKTLDLFSPYSADAALLDLFSLQGGQRLLAGRVNPNTRQPKVLAAVLAGATQASASTTGTVSSGNAQAVGSAVTALSGATPFGNRQELVSRLMNQPAVNGISKLKTERESVIRALADCSNTRTWNLMIDLVAQVGKYPAAAGSLDQFLVEGERHYWLHVAIDRYTGRVVDQQLEVVSE